MASRWEINDPTGLRYDTELGITRADSGFGPPTDFLGWIRTGDRGCQCRHRYGNCNAWMSADAADFGTRLLLVNNGTNPGSKRAHGEVRRNLATLGFQSGACRTKEKKGTAPRFQAGRGLNHVSSIL